MTITLNPTWTPETDREPPRRAGAIAAFHRSLPGYRPTPLIRCDPLAHDLGVARVYVKDEGERLGLPSFKVVGASWAVNCAIAARMQLPAPSDFGWTNAMARLLPAGTTLTCATDGNHGRAVAWLARMLGLPCRIFIPAALTEGRAAAIRSEQATVVTVDGTYDDAVRHAAAAAKAHPHHLLVSDTSWPGYEEIPAAVVDGYGTILREACAQLTEDGASSFDVAVVPAGVGSFASAVVQYLGGAGCAIVTVEPADADCVRRSIAAGEVVPVPGPHRSMMAGLNCGEVSRIAWPILRRGVRAAVAITDHEAIAATRLLADQGIRAGQCGAAALAGARHVAASDKARVIFGESSVVLLLNTEGITDEGAYAAIVATGRSAA